MKKRTKTPNCGKNPSVKPFLTTKVGTQLVPEARPVHKKVLIYVYKRFFESPQWVCFLCKKMIDFRPTSKSPSLKINSVKPCQTL